jgi:hypothetical protein
MVARPTRSDGSLELVVYSTSGLGFQQDFHLRQRGDVANLFCSPWDDGGQQWRLVLAGWFSPSSASMSAVPGAPPAKMKAPTWVSVFGEALG